MTRFRKWRLFFADRFPLAQNIIGSFVLATAMHGTLQVAAGATTWVIDVRTVAAAAIAFCTSLLMRTYDEIKDIDTDLRLANCGDARFQQRPLARGWIVPADLFALRRVALFLFAGACMFALSVADDRVAVAVAALTLLLALWLSSRWFFWPRVQRDLVLALVTHNPIAGLVGLAALAQLHGEANPLLWAALVGCAWFPLTTWETARKLRAPADETDYETYSKRLGVWGAAALTSVFAVASVVCLLIVAWHVGAPPWFYALSAAAVAAFVGFAVRYVAAPRANTANLRPLAELLMLVVHVGLLVLLLLRAPVKVVLS
jgi:4-hydroxybenzoate polyprenyltransferase